MKKGLLALAVGLGLSTSASALGLDGKMGLGLGILNPSNPYKKAQLKNTKIKDIALNDIEGTRILTGLGVGTIRLSDKLAAGLSLAWSAHQYHADRPNLDANGDPVLDGNGNPTLRNVKVREGLFVAAATGQYNLTTGRLRLYGRGSVGGFGQGWAEEVLDLGLGGGGKSFLAKVDDETGLYFAANAGGELGVTRQTYLFLELGYHSYQYEVEPVGQISFSLGIGYSWHPYI